VDRELKKKETAPCVIRAAPFRFVPSVGDGGVTDE